MTSETNGILSRKGVTGANYKSVIPVHTDTVQNQERGVEAHSSHVEVFRETEMNPDLVKTKQSYNDTYSSLLAACHSDLLPDPWVGQTWQGT